MGMRFDMKAKSVLTILVLVASAAALATALVIARQARIRLDNDHHGLEQQLARMAEMVAENHELSARLARSSAPERLPPAEFMELLRLRGEVGSLRRQTNDLGAARAENEHVHSVLEKCVKAEDGTSKQATADYWPQNTWTNSGYGSPEAALQTILWAGSNGDLTNFFAGVTGKLRQEAEGDLKKKSTAFISAEMADEFYRCNSVQIMGREVLDENTVVLKVEVGEPDDFRLEPTLMKRVGDQWAFAGEPE